MAAERGEYRSIPRVLLDGPDFQKLSERARSTFVFAKVNLGPSGIEVHYPAALHIKLAAQTGMPIEAVETSMDELEAAKEWIERDGNILWIIEQLTYDPHQDAKNENHRKGIQRHVRGLPRLPIVTRYIAHYRQWFVDAPDLLARLDGPAMPFEGPSNAPAITRPMTDDKTEDKTKNKNKTDDVARAPVHTREVGDPEPATPPERIDPPGPAMPPVIDDIERAADHVIMSANAGLKTRFGEKFNPISVGHGSRQHVLDWLNEGISAELAASTVYESAANYKPNGRHRQINTMKYFDDAVHEAFDRQRAGNTPAPRNGKHRKPQSYDYSNATNEFKGLKT